MPFPLLCRRPISVEIDRVDRERRWFVILREEIGRFEYF
jgi:hypothetical protein